MPLVEPFRLDVFVQEYKPKATVSLHDSCVAPLSLSALSKLAPTNENFEDIFASDEALSYGTIRGSPNLRASIASLYESEHCTGDDVLTTSGAILANFLILDTLLYAGDHVVVQYPTYGQLYQIPKRTGADVSLWRMREDKGWSLDIEELKAMIQPGKTKMIILNNPSNPTGAYIQTNILTEVMEVARQHDIYVLCDEVFRPLFHMSGPQPASALSLGYEKVIVTGSMSKAYALPGIRLGWIAVHSSLRHTTLQRLLEARDYTSIAISRLDDQVAAWALQPAIRANILARSLDIAQQNIALLKGFVAKFPNNIQWTPPEAAGTSSVRVCYDNGDPVDDRAFAEALVKEKSLLIPPIGYCFGTESEGDFKGYMRIGIVSQPRILEEGLGILAAFIPEYLARRP